MKSIWAPWRMEYIASEKDARENKCFLCIEPATDETSLVLARKQTAFVVMNHYPYANGHVMVVPVRHVGKIDELSDGELLDMMGLVRVLSSLLRETIHAEGLNIGINMGKAAGAGVDEHLHIHIVPRWNGDTNFMSVIGDNRVMPENLRSTYEKLSPGFHPTD